MTSDSYHTLAGPAEAIYKEKSSKFLAYAYPVESEEEIRTLLDALRKKYYDATHHCYAWRPVSYTHLTLPTTERV